MRALRVTAYMSLDYEPLTTVVVEAALKISIEETVEAMLTPGLLVIHDIFDVSGTPVDFEAGTVLAATEAMRRMDADAEQNMAALFFFNGAALGVATEAVFPTLPAPLTVEQIRTVFEQLAVHPNYNGQHVQAYTEQGHEVHLNNGHVTDLPPDSQVYR